jgi:hypothetical protein
MAIVDQLLERTVPPTRMTALELDELVPPRAGIYAAWITERSAIDEIGVTARLPLLAYVGRAAGGRGGTLWHRIGKHVQWPFGEITEMLAVRGNALVRPPVFRSTSSVVVRPNERKNGGGRWQERSAIAPTR